MSVILRAISVFKTVGEEIEILRGIHLSVHSGESIALTGVSGSGKSTLLGLLAGLDTPTSGDIEIAGQKIEPTAIDTGAIIRQHNIGFIFQAFHLLPGLNAWQNVILPLELQSQRAARSRAKDVLNAVGLGHRLYHYPHQLSGGEQQRVAIARAFVSTPQLLFADEPTGNLDHTTAHNIADLLFQINEQYQTTLILVTHDLQIARRCNRQFTLHQGTISPLPCA